MFTLLLALIAQPVHFEIKVDASRFSEYTIKIDDTILKPGKIYRTPPFKGKMNLTFTATWLEDDVIRTQNVTLEVESGERYEMQFVIPRVFPTLANV